MKNDFSSEEKAVLRRFCEGKARGHYRTTCPACSTTRRNSKAECLSVTIQAEHALYNCHHCERHGATYLKEDLRTPFTPPVYEKPKPKAVKKVDTAIDPDGVAFLAERGFSERTAAVFGVVSSRAYFPEQGREAAAIALPYVVDGKTIGHKVRSIEGKAFVCDTPLSSLYGLQNVDLAENEALTICEGEFDPMAFYEAGVTNATSVPNGSSSFNRTSDSGELMETLGFLWTARDVIDKAKKIVIAADNDAPGEKLADELSRRVGKHKCWKVSYPSDCKDGNDVLKKHGAAKLKECWDNAEAYPVDGLYEAEHYFEDMDHLYDNGFGERVSTGMAAVDEVFTIAPGMLTVITGNPNAGKSNWVNQVMLNVARSRGWVSAVCSFETPPAVHLGQLTEMLVQKHFFETTDFGERMSKAEVNSVKPFLNKHIKFLHQEDGQKATVESIIERIKVAVFRWGARIVVIDPYSYIHKPNSADSETAFIADMLTRIRITAKLYGVHVFFIAHPAKPAVNSDGSTAVPRGYSISGSAAWFNHPDHGVSVHRSNDSNDVEIHVWKTRFSWLGKNGHVSLYYDQVRHVYISEGFEELIPYKAGA